jgi:hypothetical protein
MVDDLGKIQDNIEKISKEVSDKISSEVKVLTEKFSVQKFLAGFNLANPVVLGKWLTSAIRTTIILTVIVGIIFGVGYYKGFHGKPIKIELKDGKEAYIKLDGHWLHIAGTGSVYIEDENGKVIKQITAKDVKGLAEELKPFGFELRPFAALGVGASLDNVGAEAGIGVQWAHFYKIQFDSLITTGGFYPLGFSYSLRDIKMPNSSVGIAIGQGYSVLRGQRDDRIFIYGKVKF